MRPLSLSWQIPLVALSDDVQPFHPTSSKPCNQGMWPNNWRGYKEPNHLPRTVPVARCAIFHISRRMYSFLCFFFQECPLHTSTRLPWLLVVCVVSICYLTICGPMSHGSRSIAALEQQAVAIYLLFPLPHPRPATIHATVESNRHNGASPPPSPQSAGLLVVGSLK